jgi:hypothetical protein
VEVNFGAVIGLKRAVNSDKCSREGLAGPGNPASIQILTFGAVYSTQYRTAATLQIRTFGAVYCLELPRCDIMTCCSTSLITDNSCLLRTI